MSVQCLGAGPINERLSMFYRAMQASGNRVSFGPDKNVAAIKKLYEWLQDAKFIPSDPTQNAKSNKISKQIRLKGNQLFSTDTDLSKSLELYNKSICWAEKGVGDELAISLANRSAVYFEWKEYDLCLENIDLSEKAGCPERLMDKLNKRKADCINAMNEQENEQETDADEDGSDSRVICIDTLCLKMKDLRRMKSKHFCFDVERYQCEPAVSLKKNPKIPFIANCLELKTTAQKGRYIVTKEALAPGQIISIEEPFVVALEKEHRFRKCANCFVENCLNLIPCPTCTCTMFCSEECLTESHKGFHQYECPIAEFIWNHCVEIGATFRLAVKALTMFDTVQDFMEFRTKNKMNSATTAFSYDHTAGLSDAERYVQVENLCTNEKKRSEEDLFTRGCKVAMLYHFMIKKTKFREMLRTDAERDTLMSLLFHYSQVTSINSINCCQYDDVDLEAITEFKSSDIFARGVYPLTSLFNHSCAPNIATITMGTKIITYVMRPISKNDEVLGCLKRFNHFQRPKEERQYFLNIIYGFTCNCEACQRDYPSIYEDRLPFGFITPKIKEAVDAVSFNLNEDVDNMGKFSGILRDYAKYYPTGALYDIAWKLHRAMILKHGNLASQLQVWMKSNAEKFRDVFKK